MHGMPRFTLGNGNLRSGVPFGVALVGMFGVGEVLFQLSERVARNRSFAGDDEGATKLTEMGRMWPTRQEVRESSLAVLLSSIISTVIGAIPGAGGDIASIVCWQQAKQMSRSQRSSARAPTPVWPLRPRQQRCHRRR